MSRDSPVALISITVSTALPALAAVKVQKQSWELCRLCRGCARAQPPWTHLSINVVMLLPSSCLFNLLGGGLQFSFFKSLKPSLGFKCQGLHTVSPQDSKYSQRATAIPALNTASTIWWQMCGYSLEEGVFWTGKHNTYGVMQNLFYILIAWSLQLQSSPTCWFRGGGKSSSYFLIKKKQKFFKGTTG